MAYLFEHHDSDGDELEVKEANSGQLPRHRGSLMFIVSPNDDREISSVAVPRDAALRLHVALGEWLYPVHTPEGPNRSLIEQMIDRAVKDQITAVLPLHLKTVATVTNVCDRLVPKGVRRGSACDGCGYMWDLHRMQQPAEADPEPGDVGHPRPTGPEPLLFRCRRCGASPGGAHENCAGDERACTYIRPGDAGYDLLPEPEPQHGRLMSELPRRAPKCIECTHGWGEHTGGICWGGAHPTEDHGLGCRCTRERPSAASAPKAECTCGHPAIPAVHGRLGCETPGCTCRWTGTP